MEGLPYRLMQIAEMGFFFAWENKFLNKTETSLVSWSNPSQPQSPHSCWLTAPPSGMGERSRKKSNTHGLR